MDDETEQQGTPPPASAPDFAARIGAKAARKRKAQRRDDTGLWFGLGMMGLIGWSVVVPTLLAAALGRWIDETYPGGHSWALALLVAGLTLGCINAWYWVAQQDRAMRDDAAPDEPPE